MLIARLPANALLARALEYSMRRSDKFNINIMEELVLWLPQQREAVIAVASRVSTVNRL